MAAELQIKYTADSMESNSLSTTVSGADSGWVEYCNQRGQLVYADAVSEEFYKKCQQQVIDTIVKHYFYISTQKASKVIHNHTGTISIPFSSLNNLAFSFAALRSSNSIASGIVASALVTHLPSLVRIEWTGTTDPILWAGKSAAVPRRVPGGFWR